MRETKVQTHVVEHAKKCGCKAVRFSDRDMPDRGILMPGGGVFFIEFKKWGKTLRVSQAHKRDELRSMGFCVFVVESKRQGVKIVNQMLRGA